VGVGQCARKGFVWGYCYECARRRSQKLRERTTKQPPNPEESATRVCFLGWTESEPKKQLKDHCRNFGGRGPYQRTKTGKEVNEGEWGTVKLNIKQKKADQITFCEGKKARGHELQGAYGKRKRAIHLGVFEYNWGQVQIWEKWSVRLREQTGKHRVSVLAKKQKKLAGKKLATCRARSRVTPGKWGKPLVWFRWARHWVGLRRGKEMRVGHLRETIWKWQAPKEPLNF